ncbi:hypothetical protein CEUSTIGMA_g2804.t1 [Chlamydomonas eustigma]|uniref:Uncharacterized protein n=1 Tax=Chlamydomonas eustigma TaxID=1157962 RepID=A0A250WXV8_9CHLO|nr:hypothetical protein CEUSTIGMA_g2804.t1 [Chlamydomonas eustigma]|eukprot:GAX75360.1 hypothetical protein CEUSTIGMA_g2804.t1 [Chlamydomonas eustigma]
MHADSLQKSLLFTDMSIQGVESERKELQQELALSLETCHSLSSAECLRHLQLTAGAPLSDAPDSQAVLLYFKARLAALHCEQRSMQAHLLKLRRCHLQHVKSLVLRPALSEPALPRSKLDHVGPVSQLDHVGPVSHGGCKCNQEIEVTMQGIQALQLAQADAAARNARLLQPSRTVEEGDWWIVLTHVVSMASGDRLAQRFRDRVEALPWSHHHRFLIYEQVSGMPIQRDREMLKAGLRVPPYYARTTAEAEAVLRELIEDFKCEEGADALLATQPTVHASEAASTKQGAAFSSEGSATTSDGLPSVHGILYAARKLLNKVLERHRLLTPGTPSASKYDDQGVASVTTSSMPCANLPLITPSKQRGSSVKQSDSHMLVVDRYSDRLEALIPSIQGDLSAAHAAILNGLGAAASAPLGSGVGLGSTGGSMHIDEVLRAETAFLEGCDLFQVSQRLKTLAEERKERFSYLARVNPGLGDQAREDVEEGAALSLAKTVDRSAWALSEKALEAVVTLRFLRMQRNRLKVMHYLNAMVSLQLVLLTDETTEEAAGSSTRYATTALKDMTCPIRYAARHAQNHVTAPSLGEIEGMRYGGESQSSEGVGGTSEEADVLIMDEWLEDRDSGVTVRDPSGRRLMYKHALSLMSRVEEEILRVATHHAERYAAQLYAVGRGSEVAELDQTAMLDDLWAFEAGYCEARHKCLLAYFSAYRHSESWGVMEDLFAGLGSAQAGCSGPVAAASMSCCSTGTPVRPTPDMNHSASSTNKWEGWAANTPLPQVLAARVQLRREIIDLTFRRPSICPEAGYFATSYIESTVSIELEAELVGRLTAAVAQQQRSAMATAFTSAQAAAAAASKPVAVGQAWSLGLPASVLYGELYGSGSERSLMQEGAVLPAVGAAAAALPALIRKVVGTLADVHQVRAALKHASDMSELRQRVLQYSLVELQVLLQEEQHRAHAVPYRVPKDSLFRETMGKGVGDAAMLGQFNWLCRSHVADNPVVVMSEARQLGVTPKKVVEMILNKEKVIRQLYSSEVLWLVYCCQSRALGKKVTMPELQGIDWDNIDAEGKLLKPEVLKTSLSPCEPVEEEPPGSSGPPGEELASGGGTGGGGQGIMFGVGSAGVLGGIWRAPPLALAEFSTQMAELLQPHSLAGLRAMLEGKSGLGSVGKRGAVKQNGGASATPRVIPISDDGPDAMANAARAQILRVLSLELSIKHNQILLDFIVRKLDRRRRVLMWRAAAMEGVTGRPGQGDTDLVVGAPPGHYAPAVPPGVHKPPGHGPEKYEQQIVEDPPLLRDPPKPKVLKTRYHRGIANSSKDDTGSQSEGAVSGPGGRNEGVGALSSRALNDLKACRRRLCNDASPLWLDIISLKLKLRENVSIVPLQSTPLRPLQ